MTKAELKKIILETMGKPVSGPWAKNADAIAEAIVKASPETKATQIKEVRVEAPEETR